MPTTLTGGSHSWRVWLCFLTLQAVGSIVWCASLYFWYFYFSRVNCELPSSVRWMWLLHFSHELWVQSINFDSWAELNWSICRLLIGPWCSYVPSLERIVVLRLLAQLSSVYHTVTLEKLQVCNLFFFRSYGVCDFPKYLRLTKGGWIGKHTLTVLKQSNLTLQAQPHPQKLVLLIG